MTIYSEESVKLLANDLGAVLNEDAEVYNYYDVIEPISTASEVTRPGNHLQDSTDVLGFELHFLNNDCDCYDDLLLLTDFIYVHECVRTDQGNCDFESLRYCFCFSTHHAP